MTEEYSEARARKAKKADFRKILKKVPSRKPLIGNELYGKNKNYNTISR
ncbi:MAG: hypothetical protein AABY79_10370 [Nitrospirota bacterium]